MKRRLLLAITLGASGCAPNPNRPVSEGAEFVLWDVPSESHSSSQNMDVYKIVGHGKACYLAGFGVSKVLLWCEASK